MRLIDADALTTKILGMRYTEEDPSVILTQAGQEIFNSGVEAANFAVHDAHTIDAVPVVLCKDCCYNYGLVSGAGWCKDDIVCEYHMSDGFADNDFCSHGVKMDGEDDA